MNVIRGMFGSKKWVAAIVTVVGLMVQQFFGLELSGETLAAIVAVVLGIIAAQGAKDHAIAKRG